MSQLHCPYCRGRQLQVATSTQFSTSTNVTRKEVTTTVLSQNTRYWCCADCGSTFPFPQDMKQQAEALARNAASNKKFGIFGAITGVCCLLSAAVPVPSVSGIMITLSMLCFASAVFMICVVAPTQLKQSEKLYTDYAALISKCMD